MRTLGSVMAGTVTVILVWIAVMVLFQLFTAITGYDDVNAGLLQRRRHVRRSAHRLYRRMVRFSVPGAPAPRPRIAAVNLPCLPLSLATDPARGQGAPGGSTVLSRRFG